MALEQVGNDRAFLLELLQDTLNDKDVRILALNKAIGSSNAKVGWKNANCCKANDRFGIIIGLSDGSTYRERIGT